MIWLWSNLWWLGPLLVLGAGLAHPVPRKLLEQVPARWWVRLGVLALFMVNLRGQIRYRRWFKRWEADRKARRDAERARDEDTDKRPSSGPWG